MSLYQIKDITPEYPNYNIDEEGKIVLPRNEENIIQINYADCKIYGSNTIGLLDGSKLRNFDWEELRRVFDLHHPDGKITRHYCIGGSDSGVLMGYSQYKTAKDLYFEKISSAKQKVSVETQFMFDYGHMNEELIAQGFHIRTGLTVVKDSTVFFNIRTGFMQANIDYFVDTRKGRYILEIKTCNNQATGKWGDNEIPASYFSQGVIHYPKTLEDIDIKGTYFCCMYNNNLNNLIIRKAEREYNLEDILENQERQFISYIENCTEPPYSVLDSTDAILQSLQKRYADTTPKTIQIEDNADVEESVKNYLSLSSEKSALEKRAREIGKMIDKVKIPIMEFMADSEKAEVEVDGKKYVVDMSPNKPRYSILAKDIARMLEAEPETFETYGSVKQTRKFAITEKKG